jgi:hypothetical protein
LTVEAEIARNVAGQMPSMAVFTETQQVSAAEKQSELAWQQAQLAVARRHTRTASGRMPLIVAVLVVAALLAAFFVVPRGENHEPSLTTPAKDLPWRSVAIDGGSTVELPGVAVNSSSDSAIGRGARTATSVPGATIAVTVYRGDFGMRGGGAAAVDVLKARAAELGEDNVSGRIKPNRDRWGDAYDLSVVSGAQVGRLRAIVAGASLFVIEVVGSPAERTGQIFSHVVNSLVPKQ